MSTSSINYSNKSPASTPALLSSQASTPPAIQISNAEYFHTTILTAAEPIEGYLPGLLDEMHNNTNFVPPPLSPCTALTALEGSIDKISFTLVSNIAKGLAATINKRNKEHYTKQLHIQDCVHGMEEKIQHYEDTFTIPPEGYIENNDHYPSLTIPIGNGLFQPAKWIKQLNSGRVAMLASDDGSKSQPLITKVFATPSYDSISPAEPMPYWFHDMLVGPAPIFHTLRDTVSELDNWGILANVLHFCNLDDQIAQMHNELTKLKAKAEGLRYACLLAQSHLESSNTPSKVGHLEAFSLGRNVSIICRAWKKRAAQGARIIDQG